MDIMIRLGKYGETRRRKTMIALFFFVLHVTLWIVYCSLIFCFKEKVSIRYKAKKITYKGDMESLVNEIFKNEGLENGKFSLKRSEDSSFDMEKNTIEYTSSSNSCFNGEELFCNIHEIAHALQIKEGYWIFQIRRFWAVKCKTFYLILLFILCVLFIPLFFLNGLNLWVSLLNLLLLIHYLISIIVIWSEIDANKRTLYLIHKYFKITKSERNMYTGMKKEAIRGYILGIPCLIALG